MVFGLGNLFGGNVQQTPVNQPQQTPIQTAQGALPQTPVQPDGTSFDFRSFASGLQGLPAGGGLLGGLVSGLRGYSGVKATQEAREKERLAKEQEKLLKAGRASALGLATDRQLDQAIETAAQAGDTKLAQDLLDMRRKQEEAAARRAADIDVAQIGASGQSETFQKKLDETLATGIGKTIQEAPVKIQQSQETIGAIDRIQQKVTKSPDIFGPASGASRLAGIATGGAIGLSKEERADRAAAIQDLKQVQNSQIGRATAAGLSGINSIAEREAIIAGTKPDATPEEIIAATNIMKRNEKLIQEAERSKAQGAFQTYRQFRETGEVSPIPLTGGQQTPSGGVDLKAKYGLQ